MFAPHKHVWNSLLSSLLEEFLLDFWTIVTQSVQFNTNEFDPLLFKSFLQFYTKGTCRFAKNHDIVLGYPFRHSRRYVLTRGNHRCHCYFGRMKALRTTNLEILNNKIRFMKYVRRQPTPKQRYGRRAIFHRVIQA